MMTLNDVALLNAVGTHNSNGRPKDRRRETQDLYRANKRSKESSGFITRVVKTLRSHLTKGPGPLHQQRPPRDDKVDANSIPDARVFFSRAQDRVASHPAK